MNRRERELLELLKEGKTPELSGKRQRQLDCLIQKEARMVRWLPKKHIFTRLWEQAAYISNSAWGFQLLFLLCGIWLIKADGIRQPLQHLAVMIPLVGLVGVPQLARSYSCGMGELEESCFYNMRQVILLKMLLFGIVDGLLLLLLAAAAGNRGQGAAEAFYYLVIPFNLSNAVYLTMFRVLKRRCSSFGLAAAGLFMTGAGMGLRPYGLFDIERVAGLRLPGAVWLAVLASTLVLSGVCFQLVRDLEKEELIWN